VGNRGYLAFFVPIAVAGLVCWLGANPAGAQDSPVSIRPRLSRASANRSAPNIRVDSDLVLVPVLVTDRDNRLVTGLSKDHFQVFDDKIEQQITQFSTEDTPISVALVFDCSSSMGDKLSKSRLAVAEFLKTANPEDEFALVEFNDTARIVSGFGEPPGEMQNRLAFTEAKGRTALLDGVYLAMSEMRHAKYSRKAILLISDGGDNYSRYTESEVKDRAREADIQIYSIGIMEPLMLRGGTPEEMNGAALLDEISSVTGGRMYEIDDVNQLPGVAAQLSRALRNQYLLGYSPSVGRDGKYHRIVVKLLRPDGSPRLRATFRPSYLAPEP
jgi:Ca-activated chloride channel family protein